MAMVSPQGDQREPQGRPLDQQAPGTPGRPRCTARTRRPASKPITSPAKATRQSTVQGNVLRSPWSP